MDEPNPMWKESELQRKIRMKLRLQNAGATNTVLMALALIVGVVGSQMASALRDKAEYATPAVLGWTIVALLGWAFACLVLYATELQRRKGKTDLAYRFAVGHSDVPLLEDRPEPDNPLTADEETAFDQIAAAYLADKKKEQQA